MLNEVLRECFRFVRAVVDSPDFSLNTSREVLQHDRQLRIVCNNLEKKIKNELKHLMEEEPEKYELFYIAYCYALKYSMMDHQGEKKELLSDLLMFYSSTEKKPVSFASYKQRMKQEQKFLYYVCSDSIIRADSLPQAERLRDAGYEVLYMMDDLDGFIMRSLKEYDGMTFCDITTDDLGLETQDEKQEAEKAQEENKELLDFVKETLGEAVADVKISHKLKSAPVYLSTEGDITIERSLFLRQ